MKGYYVWVGDPGYDWGDFTHGETASKAKARFWKSWSYEAEDYLYLRPIRVPFFDNKPITEESVLEYLKGEIDKETGDPFTEWLPSCKCPLCIE